MHMGGAGASEQRGREGISSKYKNKSELGCTASFSPPHALTKPCPAGCSESNWTHLLSAEQLPPGDHCGGAGGVLCRAWC